MAKSVVLLGAVSHKQAPLRVSEVHKAFLPDLYFAETLQPISPVH